MKTYQWYINKLGILYGSREIEGLSSESISRTTEFIAEQEIVVKTDKFFGDYERAKSRLFFFLVDR